MRSRRLGRFLLEVCFLAGLAALAAIARMRPLAIVGVMAFGWVVVALVEWSAWLDRPHFGRGLPPRYYLPQVSLPPPLPREQAALRLGETAHGSEEEQTWVVSSSDWAAAFAGWPVLEDDELDEDTHIETLEEFVGGPPAAEAAVAGETDAPTDFVEAETALDRLPPLPGAAEPAPSVVLPPEREPARRGPTEPAPTPTPVPRPAAAEPVPVPEPVPAPGADAAEPAEAPTPALHRIDPFAPTGKTASWWRRRRGVSGVVEVAARPRADRPPPAAVRARDAR